MDFVHLHVHSQYSFLDAASSLDSLLEKAKQLGMPAMGGGDPHSVRYIYIILQSFEVRLTLKVKLPGKIASITFASSKVTLAQA